MKPLDTNASLEQASSCGCGSKGPNVPAGSIAGAAFGTAPLGSDSPSAKPLDGAGGFAAATFGASASTAAPVSNPFGGGCACQSKGNQPGKIQQSMAWYGVMGTALLVFWVLLYWQLQPATRAIADLIPGLEHGSHWYEAVAFFIYDTPKVLMLLTLVVFGIGILRTWVTPERTRKYLAGERESAGNVLASLLGVITPFCSCSAVPLFLGFVAAGVPLGVTFSFLVAAPMVNEIALVLLYGLFGFKVAIIYFSTGVGIAIVAGWILGRLNLDNWLEPWVRQVREDSANKGPTFRDWRDRADYAVNAVQDIVGKTWKYIILGIAAGAGIHGFVPEGFMTSIMGSEAWWSVPAAVLVGIPLYANAAGIIPIVSALLGKGAALGTVLAFMMSVVALSFPEMVILRKVLSARLIAVFVSVVGMGILIVGYLFNMIL